MAAEPQTAFFSYSRDDSEFALRLAGDLKAAGAVVWIDQLDIDPGQRWDRAVEDALNNCPRMLVILSPASVNSDNVRDEISFALRKQKTVIPVLHLDCDIPLRLERHNQIDFRTDYSRGLRTLLKALGVEQPAAAGGGAAVTRQGKQERERKAADSPKKTGLKPAVPKGVYLDPDTKLMWTIRDNGKDIDWDQANQYAEQLRLAGYSDWRLPTIDELEKLYDPQDPRDYKIRKPLRLTACCPWSSTKEGSGSAWFFGFTYGKRVAVPMVSYNSSRALCVRRSGK